MLKTLIKQTIHKNGRSKADRGFLKKNSKAILEINESLKEMKNDFDRLVSILDIVGERIPDLNDIQKEETEENKSWKEATQGGLTDQN